MAWFSALLFTGAAGVCLNTWRSYALKVLRARRLWSTNQRRARVTLSTYIKMSAGFPSIVVLQVSVVLGSLLAPTLVASIAGVLTQQTRTFKVREPNLHAPDLYADKIDFIATLVDLPGAKKKQSHWQLSYQLYFIPEEKYYEALRTFPKGGSNPTPEQFPGRILLAEGNKKKTGLGTRKERTIALAGVAFKEKVPDVLRTKFAFLMTSYSVKIFDAELNTTVYKTGIFLTEPFEANPGNQDQVVARTTLYLNLGINQDGTLKGSQLRPKTSETTSQ